MKGVICKICGRVTPLLRTCTNCGTSLYGEAAPVISDKSFTVSLPPQIASLPQSEPPAWKREELPGYVPPPMPSTSPYGMIGYDTEDVFLGTHQGKGVVGEGVVHTFAEMPLGSAIFGENGTGKTTLLKRLIEADIRRNTTAFVFDPHGDLSHWLLSFAAAENSPNFLFLEPNGTMPFGLNIFQVEDPNDPILVDRTVDGILQVFKKHWAGEFAWGPRVEYILSNCSRTLIANQGYTLAELPLLLHDAEFRKKLVRNIIDPQVKWFWHEYERLASSKRPWDEWQFIESTITRVSQFLSSQILYRIVAQATSTIDPLQLLETGKVIVLSLPIGTYGESIVSLLGSLLLVKLTIALYRRAAWNTNAPRVHIYLEEYQRWATPITASLLTEGRKQNCGTTVVLHSLAELPDKENQAAVLQVGNIFSFSVTGEDARVIAAQWPLPPVPQETWDEQKKIISQSPFFDLLRGHENPQIRELTRECLEPIAFSLEQLRGIGEIARLETQYLTSEAQEQRLFKGSDLKGAQEVIQAHIRSAKAIPQRAMQLQTTIRLLNFLFTDIMEGTNTEQETINQWLREICEHRFDWGSIFYMDYDRYSPSYSYWRKKEPIVLLYLELLFAQDTSVEREIPGWLAWKRLLFDEKEFQAQITRSQEELLRDDPPEVREQTLENWKKYDRDQYGWDENNPAAPWPVESLPAVLEFTTIKKALTQEEIQEVRKVLEWEMMEWIHPYRSLEKKLQEIIQTYAQLQNLCHLLADPQNHLFSPIHQYEKKSRPQRTIADLREELVSRLVSLPRFIFCSQVDQEVWDVQLEAPRTLTELGARPEAMHRLREQAWQEYGREWMHVLGEITRRQQLREVEFGQEQAENQTEGRNLPPIKPHIPGFKPQP